MHPFGRWGRRPASTAYAARVGHGFTIAPATRVGRCLTIGLTALTALLGAPTTLSFTASTATTPSHAAPPHNAHNNVAAAEPSGYWTGPINAPVPKTLSGGTVIHNAHQLRALLRQGGTVIVDVSNAPRRPENLAPGAPWLPLPHRGIPGSLWIPSVGLGEIPLAVDDFYRQRLAAATNEHLARPVIVYCHKTCWLSWNAAKRAISYGYRNVYWYPYGIEGWKAAGYRTAVIEPQVAPEK